METIVTLILKGVSGFLQIIVQELFKLSFAEMWKRLPKPLQGKLLYRFVSGVYFLFVKVPPSFACAFLATALVMGVYMGILQLPDTTPPDFRDAILFTLFGTLFTVVAHLLIPTPKLIRRLAELESNAS